MAFIYNLSDTWNDGAVTFTGIGLNVTDSASNAASNLLNLQTGGVSRFRVSKTGAVTSDAGITTGGSATINGNVNLPTANNLNWGGDVILARDAANTLAQRNGTNAQTFNIYNTFTDASNYERGVMRWSGNILQIGTQAAGTGTSRVTQIVAGTSLYSFQNNDIAIFPAAGGVEFTGRFRFSSPALGIVRLTEHNGANAGALELTEWAVAPAAPAANNVRIYAEDNGAGKTRLMALFATGAAQQIAIEP